MESNSFTSSLIDDGFTPSRVSAIVEALDKLHYALGQCDSKNRRIFFSQPLESRLKTYGKAVGLSDVTETGFKIVSCFYAPNDDKGIRIEVVTKDDPNHKVLCEEIDGVKKVKVFPHWDEACIYAMKKNLEYGLLANDVSAILKSSEVAGAKEHYEHVLGAVSRDLMNEKVCRGLSVDEAAKTPSLLLAEKVRRNIDESFVPDRIFRELVESQEALRLMLEAYAPNAEVTALKDGEKSLHSAVQAARKAVKATKVLPVSVTIQKDQDGEYRVPGPAGKEEAAACYTNDKEDAIGTAKAMYGADTVIKFKTVEQHISVENSKLAVDVPVNAGRARR